MLKSSAFRFWGVLSFLVTIASVVSLVENWHLVDWKGFFASAVEFYRGLASPFFDFGYAVMQDHPFVRLFRVADWPIWLRDVWVLSLFGSGPAAITLASSVYKGDERNPEDSLYLQLFASIVIGGTLLGIPVLLAGLLLLIWPPNWIRIGAYVFSGDAVKEQEGGGLGQWLSILLAYCLVVLTFFVINGLVYD